MRWGFSVRTLGIFQGQMYVGALFIEQVFGWNLYASVILLLAITAVFTIMGECHLLSFVKYRLTETGIVYNKMMIMIK